MQQPGIVFDIESFLCACLCGESPAWPFGENKAIAASFIEQADFHGVLPLLYHLLTPELARKQGWPNEVVEACRRQAIARTMWELRHQHLLGRALGALDAAGIKPVLIKGTVLAYSLYSSPGLRPRADSDLIIAPRERFKTAGILAAQGFVAQQNFSCEYLSYEASFTHDEAGVPHTLDVHWRLHYSQLMSRLFPHEILLRRANPLPALCPTALAVDPVYALLIACVHRANDLGLPQWSGNSPSYGSERLIWLYDFHLLIESMTPLQLSEFMALMVQKGLREICRDGIEKARDRFNTKLPEPLVAALSRTGPDEAVTQYLRSGMFRQRWMDWFALTTVSDRTAFLIEHIFPPSDYMHERFPSKSPEWLPLLYLRRLTEGIGRRIYSKRP